MSGESDSIILAVGILAFLLCGSGTKAYVSANSASAQIYIEANKQRKKLEKEQLIADVIKRNCEYAKASYDRTTKKLQYAVDNPVDASKIGWITDYDREHWNDGNAERLANHLAHPPTC